MTDINTNLTINLVDRFSNRTRRIGRGFRDIEREGTKSMRAVNRAASAFGNTLDRLGNRYTALITSAAGLGSLRSVAAFQRRLKYLGIQANKTDEDIAGLQKRIFDIARSPDIRIDPNQLLDAVDKIVEKTGDLDLAFDNIRNIGLAVRASNAMGVDIGAMLADLDQKFDLKNSEEMLQALDLLVNQGKAGAFTLQNLATQGERVTAAYAATGRVGIPAIREMGAMLQMIKQGTGSPEQAATAFEALLRTLNDADKRKLLTKNGIQLTDPDDPKRLRDVTKIVKDVIRATGGDMAKLSTVFDSESMRALTAVAAEYQKTGAFQSLDNFLSQASDGGQIAEDAARGVDQLEGAMSGLGAAWDRYSFSKMAGPLKDVVEAFNSLDPETLDTLIDVGVKGTIGLGGLILGRKVMKMRAGKKSAAGAASAGMAGLEPIPVWVVNMGAMGGPVSLTKKGAGAAGVGVAATRFGKIRALGSKAVRGAGPTVAGIQAVTGAAELASGAATGNKRLEQRGAGTLSGMALGTAAGAGIGSVVPGFGTAIGAIVGSIVGGLGGNWLGDKLGGFNQRRDEERIGVDIRVDQDGRVSDVRARSKRGDLDVDVDRGVIMNGGGGF